jgi:hypothetical protein
MVALQAPGVKVEIINLGIKGFGFSEDKGWKQDREDGRIVGHEEIPER